MAKQTNSFASRPKWYAQYHTKVYQARVQGGRARGSLSPLEFEKQKRSLLNMTWRNTISLVQKGILSLIWEFENFQFPLPTDAHTIYQHSFHLTYRLS